MRDEIIRAITEDGWVKAAAITGTGIVERARQIHKTLPIATAALGRTLCAASLMGNMQKTEDGSLTLQIRGNGPLGKLLAVSDWKGNVRGCVDHPQVSLLEKYRGKLDVGAAVGKDGTLTVIRDLRMKDPYVGTVPLVSGEIAEDVTQYFAQSEQTPTVCALGVLVERDQTVKCAGGYIVQLLPGAPEEVIAKIEKSVAGAGSVTEMMTRGLDAQGMLQTVLAELAPKFLERDPVEYRCNCSRARVESMLVSLGKDELEDILQKGEDLRVDCQFCDAPYIFTPEDVKGILRGISKHGNAQE